MPTAFMGMRGTGNFADNQVPESWAQYILHEYPNGSAPLFAMTSMFKQENVDSYKYHWFKKTLPTQSGAGSVYIDAGLVTAYVYATHQAAHGIATAVVYVKVAEALAKEFNKNALVLLRDSDRPDEVEMHGRVVDTYYNGASSYVAVKLLEDDDNGSVAATYNLSTVDLLMRLSNAQPDGSVAPNAIGYDPDEYWNYVQNFRNTLDLTQEALATRLRTGDAYKEAKKDCAELHSIDIEKAAFFGYKYAGTGENGQPLRTTQGYIDFIKENNSGNVLNYETNTDAAYAGKTWLQAGKKFLNTYITQVLKYTDSECIVWCGDAALLGISELAEAFGDIQLKTSDTSYGISITTWQVPAGKIYLRSHPLFSHESTNQNLMVLMHPKDCKFCPLVGGGYNFRTKFETDMQIPGQHSKVDGYTTKGGWKFASANKGMVLYGIGKDNTA